MQPRLLFVGREVFQNLHKIADHLLTDAPDKSGTFRRDADHHLAAVLPHTRSHDVVEVFEPCDQTARGRRRVPHLPRNRGHREDFLLVQESEQKKLGKGNIARRQLLAKMQYETALHFQNNMGKPLGVGANLVGRSSCKRSDNSRIQAG